MKLVLLATAVAVLLDTGGAMLRFLGPDDDLNRVMPGIPETEQASAAAYAAGLDVQLSGQEARAAAAQAHAAEIAETTARSSLEAASKESEAVSAVRLANIAAKNAIKAREEADIAATKTREVVDALPVVVHKAEQRAVKDAVNEAVAAMNKVVAEVLLAYTTGNGAASKAAASRAQAEALPFQAGKIRAEEIMYSYALQAKELAKAVGTLKEKAVEIAGASQPLQERGNGPAAQQLQMQAKDLMDKAAQLQGQARAFDAKAHDIQGGLGSFDKAAERAAAYAAYQTNPGGEVSGVPPPPPLPLEGPPLPPSGTSGAAM